jgi:aspartate kinase
VSPCAETGGGADGLGYFGPVPGSLLAQIGRGYTDLCAALCAVGLKASELQVWKEVDGIFTADPRKVPTARLVPVITPDEAAELTYYGSEVIHPFTMEQVIRARIPIRIKNVENPRGEGTIIYPDDKFPRGAATEMGEGTSSVTYQASNDEIRVETKVPTAVTIKDNIIVLNIHSNRKTISHGFLARIFGTLDRAGVVVDLISTSEVHVSMAMQDISSKKRLDRLTKDLEKIGDITISKDMAILSLVGKNMRHAVGCAGMMFTALAKAGINIEMISQGASEINISCGKSRIHLPIEACPDVQSSKTRILAMPSMSFTILASLSPPRQLSTLPNYNNPPFTPRVPDLIPI